MVLRHRAVTDFELGGGYKPYFPTSHWPPLGPFFLPSTLPPSWVEVGGK
jgi:hypothetical protein